MDGGKEEIEGTKIDEVIHAEAMQNSDFRSALLDDPRRAISKYLGVELPDEIDLRVHIQRHQQEVHIVLPFSASDESYDPDDEHLMMVNGTAPVVACGTTVPGGTCYTPTLTIHGCTRKACVVR